MQCDLLVDLLVARIFNCIEQPAEVTSMERDRFPEASEPAVQMSEANQPKPRGEAGVFGLGRA